MRSVPTLATPHARFGIAAFFGLHEDERRRAVAVMLLAAATVVTELAGLAGWIPNIDIGRIVVSMSVVPAAVLAAALGHHVLGRTAREHAAIAFWACAAVAVLACAVAYRSLDHATDLPGLVLATADEELVYRCAVPAVVALLLCLAGVRRSRAWIFGFAVAGVWFVALPGHRAQWDNAFSILAFAAFAALMAFVVYRSGSVAAAALAHLCADLLTILVWNDVVARPQRSAVLGVVLVLLVLAYGPTPRRTGRGVVIDLRDGHVPSLQRGGSEPIPIVEPVPPLTLDRPSVTGPPQGSSGAPDRARRLRARSLSSRGTPGRQRQGH